MNRKALFVSVVLNLMLATAVLTAAAQAPQSAKPAAQPVAIPFELVTKHIVLKVSVNNSRPLSFVFDTGDKYAVIDLNRAKELGLDLHGQVRLGGAGAETSTGFFVRDSSFTIPGLPGFSQPVRLALPIGTLALRFGQDLDGIIGTDFIKEFVVEIDYQARMMRLHNKNKFTYTGRGAVIPIQLDSAGHPTIEAEVTPIGSAPIKGKFVMDLGSGAALALYSPFVRQQQLLGPHLRTIKMLGAGGAGGQITGQIGRVSQLQIGEFSISSPITLFSEDKAGAFASSALLGNIGAQIMSKFRVWLDYDRERVILEPNETFAKPFDRAYSGLAIQAEGKDYRTFRITDVLENSPASAAGLQKDDIITAVDGQQAAELTLTKLGEMLERSTTYKLSVRRGEQTLVVKLTPARLV
ncbi:MAG: aspartyl protease family protein [Pyrinomonadaceae bacterium]